MSITPVERVRHAVIEHLARLSGDSLASPCESILIRNGLYCGRKFQWQGYEVVWFLEEDQIKFFGPCGNLLYSSPIISFLQVVDDHVAQVGSSVQPADQDCSDRSNRFAA
jgi:hypothetical protein